MRFSAVAATAVLAAGANASGYGYGHRNETVYTTEVVNAYTTVCPGPTKITHGAKVYTVTKATTLTITDCPCTITKPVHTAVVTSCSETPVKPPVTPVPIKPSAAPVPIKNVTAPAVPVPTTAAAPQFTGAANRAFAASGAGLAALFGVVAYVL